MVRTTFGVGLLICISFVACRAERSPSVARRPNATAAAGCADSTVSGAGVGPLRIGALIDSVRTACLVVRDTTEVREEGLSVRVASVVIGRDTVEAEIDSAKVWRLEVTSGGLRTADSLGVGTPLARLLQLPGVHGAAGEGAVFVLAPAHCGVSFELSEAGSNAPPPEWDLAALRQLPASTVVSRVLVTGCQAAS